MEIPHAHQDAGSIRARWPVLLTFPLAGLVAAASLGGLLLPATYANETPGWAREGMVQDWFDLVLVCPLLILSAVQSFRGSANASGILTGLVLFVAYSFLIYAFDVHFNGLFLVYCAALGIAGYALAGLCVRALDPAVPLPGAGSGARRMGSVAGWFLLVVAALFAALWLSEILPAIAAGKTPDKILSTGLPTNPVHVIDLSFFLPAQAIVAIALIRRRRLGYALAPALLAFGVMMAALITTNQAIAIRSGSPASLPALAVFVALIAAYLSALILFMRPGRKARNVGAPA